MNTKDITTEVSETRRYEDQIISGKERRRERRKAEKKMKKKNKKIW